MDRRRTGLGRQNAFKNQSAIVAILKCHKGCSHTAGIATPFITDGYTFRSKGCSPFIESEIDIDATFVGRYRQTGRYRSHMKFRAIQIVCPDSRYRKRSDCLYRLSGKITNYDQPLAVGCCKSQETSSGPVGCLHQPGERAPRIKEFRMFPPQLQQFCITLSELHCPDIPSAEVSYLSVPLLQSTHRIPFHQIAIPS